MKMPQMEGKQKTMDNKWVDGNERENGNRSIGEEKGSVHHKGSVTKFVKTLLPTKSVYWILLPSGVNARHPLNIVYNRPYGHNFPTLLTL